NRLERTLRQCPVTDFAPARATCPSGFANAKWREIVVQNEALRLHAATIGVDVLRFFNGSESGQGERLGFAPLKYGGAMSAREDADFAADGTQILITATVHALLLFENAAAT